MGVDPHFDARQSLACIARIADSGLTSRALIQLEDQTESMLVDLVKYDGVLIRELPGKGEPMILARVAYHAMDPNKHTKRKMNIIQAIGNSMPPNGISQTIKCCSKEEMGIIKGS